MLFPISNCRFPISDSIANSGYLRPLRFRLSFQSAIGNWQSAISHSLRSATIGSTLVARRAGIMQANMTASVIDPHTTTKSSGPVPIRSRFIDSLRERVRNLIAGKDTANPKPRPRPLLGVRRLVGALADFDLTKSCCIRVFIQLRDFLHRTWRQAATGQSADKAAHSKETPIRSGPPYSYLNATNGSTRVARRAGK